MTGSGTGEPSALSSGSQLPDRTLTLLGACQTSCDSPRVLHGLLLFINKNNPVLLHTEAFYTLCGGCRGHRTNFFFGFD